MEQQLYNNLALQAVRKLPNGNTFIVRLHRLPAGVYVVTENRPSEGNSAFNSRNFRVCKSYPTVADNMARAIRAYKLSDAHMGWSIERFSPEPEFPDAVSYSVFQTERHGLMFSHYDWVKDMPEFNASEYPKVYEGTMPLDGFGPNDADPILEEIFRKLNIAHPGDYHARSLTCGDIVVLSVKGGVSGTYFVDAYGFKKLPDSFFGKIK